MNFPILYTFRRCPYAMRARMALYHAKINYEHREILLKNRPKNLYEISPKGTVPVLDLLNGEVIDESFDKEQMEKPAEPWELRAKKTRQRLIIMIGGVTVNLLLGFIIYIGVVFSFGKEQVKIGELQHGMAIHPYLEQFNLLSGDIVLEVNGEKVCHINDVNKQVLLHDAQNLKVKDGKTGKTKTSVVG